jgi:anti-sigma B factor antagonist
MLTIADREQGDVVILDLAGQIDGGPDSEKIQRLIKSELGKGKRKFILNLKEVKWLNSLGAGVMIASYASAKREDASLKLLAVSDRVATVLRTCGLIPEVFDVYNSEDEALASF